MNPLKWGLIEPFYKLMIGEDRKGQINTIVKMIGLPLAGLLIFLMVWQGAASHIKTSLGQFPGPVQTYEQFISLSEEAKESSIKEDKFYQRQEVRNERKLEKDPNAVIKVREYTGPPTFFD